MTQSPFFARIHEFTDAATAFDESTAQLVAAGFGDTPAIWAFLNGPRGGTWAGDIALETMRGRSLEGAVARTIARWQRWTVNRHMAHLIGCRPGTTFLVAAIGEANAKGAAA